MNIESAVLSILPAEKLSFLLLISDDCLRKIKLIKQTMVLRS